MVFEFWLYALATHFHSPSIFRRRRTSVKSILPPQPSSRTRIDVLELEETLAVVRVLEEGWGGSIDFTDVLLLLKIDGEWKCVAKAYNQNSNTITK